MYVSLDEYVLHILESYVDTRNSFIISTIDIELDTFPIVSLLRAIVVISVFNSVKKRKNQEFNYEQQENHNYRFPFFIDIPGFPD